MELCQVGHWAWWVDETDDDGAPESGKCEFAQRHRRRHGAYDLTAWFYLSPRAASQVAHGRELASSVVSIDEDEESFSGLMFSVTLPIKLDDLWFEPSAYPERMIQPEDETLDYMADNIHTLVNEPAVIARFEAAAAVGGERLNLDIFRRFQGEYAELLTTAIVKATFQAARAPQSKGGRAKAEKTAGARDAVRESWAMHDKRGRGAKTAFITSQAAQHGVSPRTIENWLK